MSKHRQQFVSLGKNENNICSKITFDVLQRSILGPPFFLLYINDPFRTSSKLTPNMFADNKNLFISNSNIKKIEKMNEALRK